MYKAAVFRYGATGRMYPKDKRIIVSPKISPDFCLETFYYLPTSAEREGTGERRRDQNSKLQ